MRPFLLAITWGAAAGAKWPLRARHAPAFPATFDCAMRKAASYAYG